jgi:hypothetical protein
MPVGLIELSSLADCESSAQSLNGAGTIQERPLLTLYPYLLRSIWVFDDERTGLKEEAFVLGMTEMISRLVETKRIPNAAKGFSLSFSDRPFDGYDADLKWLMSDDSQIVTNQDGTASPLAGNWYQGIVAGETMKGWLCPALGLYFNAAPQNIFIRADPLPLGINPIWLPPLGQRERRFVSAPRT